VKLLRTSIIVLTPPIDFMFYLLIKGGGWAGGAHPLGPGFSARRGSGVGQLQEAQQCSSR
jgi:hypothetical protein